MSMVRLLGRRVCASLEEYAKTSKEIRQALEGGDIEITALCIFCTEKVKLAKNQKVVDLPQIGRYKLSDAEGKTEDFFFEEARKHNIKGRLLSGEDFSSIKKAVITELSKQNKIDSVVEDGRFVVLRDGEKIGEIVFETRYDQALKKNIEYFDEMDAGVIEEEFDKKMGKHYSVVPNSVAEKELDILTKAILRNGEIVEGVLNKNELEIDAAKTRRLVCRVCGEKPVKMTGVGCSCHQALSKGATLCQSPVTGRVKIIFPEKWEQTLSQSLKDWGIKC